MLHADVDRFSSARRAMRNAIRRWRREGCTILEATPTAISKGNGSSFADLLKAAGLEAVKERIETALTPRSLAPRMPVDQARRTVDDAMKSAFEELSSWAPPSI